MRWTSIALLVGALGCVGLGNASAQLDFSGLNLLVDSAPNRYGSANWAPWWDQAKADVVAGSFTDMRTGTHPGTHVYDPYDEIVYSTMDLGKRLHWIYWVPNTTIGQLNGLFEVKWVIDWAGTNWTYEGGGWAEDGAEVGWSQPASWEAYQSGVIGSFGFAWWATDDEALPFTTDGDPYNETNQDDVDALRGTVLQYQTFALGKVRYRETLDSDWAYRDLELSSVPEPSSLILLGVFAGGAVALARLRRKR